MAKHKRTVGEVVVLTRDCEVGQEGERAVVTEIDGIYMTLYFEDRAPAQRKVNTGADYRFLRRGKRVMIMFLDYTDLPRAYGIAPTREEAEAEARRQLASYCAKQQALGEIDLADLNKYTMQRHEVD